MAAGPYSIDPTTYLDDLLSQASPDLMRQMLQGVLLQSWARVEKPNLKTSVVLAPGCLSCLEYPADDHRVWVRVPVGKHRALAFP